jgi:hypothetical protein
MHEPLPSTTLSGLLRLISCHAQEVGFGSVGTLNSFPSTLTPLSAVAGPLNPLLLCVPSFTSTPPLPTFTVLASADCKSAEAPPTGWSGRGRLAWTRAICSSLFCSERICSTLLVHAGSDGRKDGYLHGCCVGVFRDGAAVELGYSMVSAVGKTSRSAYILCSRACGHLLMSCGKSLQT